MNHSHECDDGDDSDEAGDETGRHQTNVQLIERLMNFSRHGALMQAFVLEALGRYAKACAAADPREFDTPLLNGAAWHGCAVEASEALDLHLGRAGASSGL
jgi:hypothetical protein